MIPGKNAGCCYNQTAAERMGKEKRKHHWAYSLESGSQNSEPAVRTEVTPRAARNSVVYSDKRTAGLAALILAKSEELLSIAAERALAWTLKRALWQL